MSKQFDLKQMVKDKEKEIRGWVFSTAPDRASRENALKIIGELTIELFQMKRYLDLEEAAKCWKPEKIAELVANYEDSLEIGGNDAAKIVDDILKTDECPCP